MVWYSFYLAWVGAFLHAGGESDSLRSPLLAKPIPFMMRDELPKVLLMSTAKAIVAAFASPIPYILMRARIWKYSLMLARIFYR